MGERDSEALQPDRFKVESWELWAVFHKLWSRDKDSPNYDKSQWMQLESLILRLDK